jgi:urease accessory protein
MHVADPVHLRSWRARLGLDYERRGPRTVLAARRQDGPLVVQRPFYPEGDTVCHTLVVHPPAGIAGGDDLELAVQAGADACILLTTPGATRWYRSAGPWARQALAIDATTGACIEWLPQETIVFDGALADIQAEVKLGGSAVYIGWELLCLGRTGSGERYTRGECRARTRIWRNDVLIWYERARIEAGGVLARAPAGLAGRTVCGTMLAAAPGIGRELLTACRAEQPSAGESAVTLLPDLLVARYLGDSSEAARHYFIRLWRRLRPALCGRASVEPRIWNT